MMLYRSIGLLVFMLGAGLALGVNPEAGPRRAPDHHPAGGPTGTSTPADTATPILTPPATPTVTPTSLPASASPTPSPLPGCVPGWTLALAPDAGVLRGIAVAAPNAVWAAGSEGILRYDGSAWRREAFPTAATPGPTGTP